MEKVQKKKTVILSQMNPVHTLPVHFFKNQFHIIFPSMATVFPCLGRFKESVQAHLLV
jgi:hypothetical protein